MTNKQKDDIRNGILKFIKIEGTEQALLKQ